MNIGMLLVKHMMVTNVITASPSMTVKETIEMLYEKHIGCVVSIDDDKKCIGIFTERDAIRLVAKNVQLDQPLDNVIRNICYVWDLGCNVELFPFTPIPGTGIFAELPPELRDRPLSALHPTLFPCVQDEHDADVYYGLMPLNSMNGAGIVQSERFTEYVEDPAVVEMLAR